MTSKWVSPPDALARASVPGDELTAAVMRRELRIQLYLQGSPVPLTYMPGRSLPGADFDWAAGVIRTVGPPPETLRFETERTRLENLYDLAQTRYRNKLGRDRKFPWDEFWYELVWIIHNEGLPERRTILSKRMRNWFIEHCQGDHPDDRDIQRHIARLYERLGIGGKR